jgi:hypothetical protein
MMQYIKPTAYAYSKTSVTADGLLLDSAGVTVQNDAAAYYDQ